MWASLATNPFAAGSLAASAAAAAASPLGAAAPVQPVVASFRFNFAVDEDADNGDDDGEERKGGEGMADEGGASGSTRAPAAAAAAAAAADNEDMLADAADSEAAAANAAALAASKIVRQARQHTFAELTQPATRIDEADLLSVHADCSFAVTPLGPPAEGSAAAATSASAASGRALCFLKRRSPVRLPSSLPDLSECDLTPSVYEGGFKVWECAVDLIVFLHAQLAAAAQAASGAVATSIPRDQILFPRGLAGARVAELGCGHAFPALWCLQQGGAAFVAMQDYNSEVIAGVALDNARMNANTDARAVAAAAEKSPASGLALAQFTQAEASRCGFFSGDWNDPNLMAMMGAGSYDLLLTSDTLYSSAYMLPLFSALTQLLSPGGIALIAAKRYYFGIGGSTLEFVDLVAAKGKGKWECSVAHTFEDGRSNIREILVLRRKA